jgi:hypothetical protein
VAVQKVLVSSADPGYASIGWGFAAGGMSALHDSVLGLTSGAWKVLWTRDKAAPADGACVYVPPAVAHDLLSVRCPPPAKLRARPAGRSELRLITRGFGHSDRTPYARTSTGLAHVCISRADATWAGAIAEFDSGARIYVFFHYGRKHWTPRFESLLQQGARPPALVLLSLASCVGFNPSDYDA